MDNFDGKNSSNLTEYRKCKTTTISSHSPLFGPYLLWPNGRPSQQLLSSCYDLLQQLPPPILITGDFNSQSTLWGYTKLDRRGKVGEDILIKHNLCILNDTCPTIFTPPQVHLQLLISVYAVRIFFWTCNGRLWMICVGVIIIPFQ